jgi:YVTN family beta-propeller protein
VIATLRVVRDPGTNPPAIPLSYSALAVVDAAGRTVDDAVSLPGAGRVAMNGGVVWAANDDSGTVSAVDQQTRRVERTVATGVFPSDIAAGAGALWVVDGARGRLVSVDESYDEVRKLDYRPSGQAPPDRFGFDPTSIAVGEGAVWITDGGRRLLRVDPDSATRAELIPIGTYLAGVAVGEGSVWVISGDSAQVLRIHPVTRAVTMRLPLVDAPSKDSGFPRALAVGAGFVWVLNGNTGAVTKIDPRARGVVGTVKIGVERVPVQLAADDDALWVANEDGTLARVDAVTDEVEFHDVGRTLRDVAAGGGDVWVTNRLADCCGLGF